MRHKLWFVYHSNDVTDLDVWHDSCAYVKSHIHLCDVIHSYMEQQFFYHSDDVTYSCAWHGRFTNAWHDLSTLETWLIYMCDMTNSFVQQDSFMFVTWRCHALNCDSWLIFMCNSDSFTIVTSNSLIHLTWRIHMCDKLHSCVWYDALIRVWGGYE